MRRDWLVWVLVAMPMLAQPVAAASSQIPASDVIKNAASLKAQGALFEAIVLYRLALTDSTKATSLERSQAIIALQEIASELRTKGLSALSSEIDDFVRSHQSPPTSPFPTRHSSEITGLFDSAAKGTLETPRSELSGSQLEWRRLLTGAVSHIANNARSGVVGRPNREVLSSALVEGLTGKDPGLVRSAAQSIRAGNSAGTLSALEKLIDSTETHSIESGPYPAINGAAGGDSQTDAVANSLIGGASLSPSARSCKNTMAHMASRLPEYDLEELRAVRQAILSQDVQDALRKARAMGISPADAAAQTLQSAGAAEGEKKVASACIHNFASRPNAVIAALESGTYRFGTPGLLPDGSATRPISQACASGYVAVHYTAIAMRELAVQLACHASITRN